MTGSTGTLPDRRESPASQSRVPAENGADMVTSTAAVIELAVAAGEMVAITGP
jgi:hypothetical protein